MDNRVLNLVELLKSKQKELDDKEWEGLAPEGLQSLIMEIEELKEMHLKGELFYPTF